MSLERVTLLAEKQKQLQAWIEAKELELKELKEQLMQVKCNDLPDLMAELGLMSFKLEDGSEIAINRDINAYIKVEDKDEVYNWLKLNNHGSIIKAVVSANFGRSESELAEKIYQTLLSEGIMAIKKEDIHWQTFKKFVKECQEEGVPLHEKIQVQPIVEAKIK